MHKNEIDIITLGCSKNLVDAERLMHQLELAGYRCVHDSETPKGEIAVINTCGFIGDAKEESINTILQFAERKTHKQLRQLYNSHTDAHFHIISISLDDNAAEWRNTIQSQGMTWTNLSEHKRWNSDIVKLYSIDHIPQHILIDRNGTVISKNQSIETISKLIKPNKTNHQSKNKIK